MHSKNDVFTTDWSVRPPPRLKPPISIAHVGSRQERQPGADSADPGCDVPLSIPAIVEPPASTSVKPSEGLAVRLLPHQELGHGRHATVHLALYREDHQRPAQLHSDLAFADRNSSPAPATWKVCAAKRFAAGKDAQVAGLSEALMLSRLAKCSHVLKYIGLKDERPLARPSSSRESSFTELADADGNTSRASDSSDPPSSRPSISRSHSNTSISTPSSPIRPRTPDLSVPALLGLQQRQQEESKVSLRRNATVKAPKPPSQLAQGRKPLSVITGTNIEDAPRMLLLTEYCALGNLAMFVLNHGQDVLGPKMFFKLAADLMTALVAVHERNIIHGDVKPQNCMIDQSFNLKLGDFSSSLFNSPDLDDGIGLGTTQYSSPEVVRMPPSPFSFPIDIFSAGLSLLFMITGVQPYESLTMASTNRSERFTPKSPRSPRGTPGNVTPTSLSAKRKYRSSSGAGKMVELHVHLSKGNAWDWEERRRLQELEEDLIDAFTETSSSPSSPVQMCEYTVHLKEVDTSTASADLQDLLVENIPDSVCVPKELLDHHGNGKYPQKSMQTYSDGYTPVQTFLNGAAVVPEELRNLIKSMLDPTASSRPSATQVLKQLDALQCV